MNELKPIHAHLLSKLSPDADLAQQLYIQLHHSLQLFFEWRGCCHAEEAVDATLDRVNNHIEKGKAIPNIHAFIAGVGRRVSLEFLRLQKKFVELPHDDQFSSISSDSEEHERALACLDQCVSKLRNKEDQVLIRKYYERRDRENLAAEIGININTLRLRADRIRDKLERCVVKCMR